MCSVSEKPPADDLQPQTGQTARVTPAMLGARRRKETLLPEITQLALEGHSSQAIADKLGMPKRTVNYWLQEARREWIARAALSAAEMFAADLARLDAIYREAMQAWRNSQSEIDVRLVQHSQTGDGKSITKRSLRSQPQRGNAAFLTRATAAVMASWRLKGKPGPPCPDAIARELPVEADGGTLPADVPNEDLETMSEDQLRDYRARLSATIEAIDELADFRAFDAGDDSPPAPENVPPVTVSLPTESGSLPIAPEVSPPVAESRPPVPERLSPIAESSPPASDGLPPATESSAPEENSDKFGQRPASLIRTLLQMEVDRKASELRKLMKEGELRKFGQKPPSGAGIEARS